MNSWRKQKLSSLCLKVASGGTPSRRNPKYYTDYAGHLWVKSKELLEKGIYDTEEKISDAGLNNSSAKYYPKNTVLIAMYGANAGQMAWLDVPATVNQAICALVVDSEKADWRFLYYSLLESRKSLVSLARGGAQPNLNKDMVENFEISFTPDIETQKGISRLIGHYDDLIEINEMRIKALEEMAQLLYTEWFVKFKFPGHEKIKLVKSNTFYGEIPANFKVVKITELVDFVRGIEPGSSNYHTTNKNGTIPFLRVGDLGSRDSGIWIEQSLAKGKIADRIDILVTMDGTVGRVAIGMYGAYSTGIRKLVIINDSINREFLYLLMLSDYIQNVIKSHARGSTILHASESINHMQVLLPQKEIIEEFSKKVNPFLDEILNLQESIRTLTLMRDLLIPQLVTGKRELKNI